MREQMPEVYRQFEAIAERLERHYRDVQDLEFTIERGHLYMLQTRSAKRTAAAAVKIAADLVREGHHRPQGSARRASSRPTWTSSCATSSIRSPRARPSAWPRA